MNWRGSLVAWRVAGLVAAVFGHFLIFAQFSWIEILRDRGMSDGVLRLMLALMAVGGIAGGVLAALRVLGRRTLELRLVLAGTGVLTIGAGLATGPVAAGLVSLGCGLGIGAATVATASGVAGWLGRKRACLVVGTGSGLGYAVCNVPAVFTAAPAMQVLFGAGFVWLAAVLVPGRTMENPADRLPLPAGRSLGIVAAVLAMTALVWLDSAAFFIIQHTAQLKAGTWGGGMLWRNAGLHLAGAVLAGWWLDRGGLRGLLGLAFLLLGAAAWLVQQDDGRVAGACLYPVAVSLYSTALVCWPALLAGGGLRRSGWRAAVLFAIAGWIGSANGIGMVTQLDRIPMAFVMAAGVAVALAVAAGWRGRMRVAVLAGVALLAIGVEAARRPAADAAAVDRGRAVYVAEGCIHCHSRYVRPASPDLDAWGPPAEPGEVIGERPVLIGNRRQGPDLLRVGARRSASWLKLKLEDPARFAAGTPMPSFAHLLKDGRADDLIAYLQAGAADSLAWRLQRMNGWRPQAEEGHSSKNGDGLFRRHCAICHGPEGRGDGVLAGRLLREPANLVAGPFTWTGKGAELELRTARVVKFGIPGGEMPGHEVLGDDAVLALARYVIGLRSR
jgi:cbb3-type cytochrome oxidase cytochrome c subunit